MPHSLHPAHGFTLVEIMVVIVIITIFAGMMTLSVGGSDSQRNRAFYEHLQSNLGYLRLLSAESMQPYGLAIKPQQNSKLSGELVVVKLENSGEKAHWQVDNQVEPLTVPANILLDIRPTSQPSPMVATKPVFDPSQAPPIIWFGNGEATPVQIFVRKVNPANDSQAFEVGNPIILNASGAVEVTP